MADTQTETPAPRKRGRPRKAPTETPAKPAKTPRKRGRPPAKRGKTAAKPGTNPPKKRGRPPKNPDKLRPEYVDGYTFDPTRAARVVDFIEQFCVQSKGKWAGKPYQLMDWQKNDVIGPLFGWVDEHGNRRYRTASIFTPKKCGKSTLAAAFCLYFLIADREPGAEVVIAASDRNQAGIIARELFAIVKSSPFLSKRLEVIESRNTIIDRDSNSRAYVISSESHRAEGINAHAVIVDELHAQKDRRLFDALKWAGSARDQPMFLTISTAGYDKSPGAIWWEQWQYAERVAADPKIDPAFFGKIYAAPPVDDVAEYFTDKRHWYTANPSLGVTMSEQSFAADAREAENSPSKINAWLRYRLNVPTQADTRWIAPATWALGSRQWSAPVAGRKCWAGLDLASTRDLTAFVAIFEDDDGGFDVDAHFWIPADNVAERSRADNVPYADFVRDGWLKTTPGNIADYDAIRAFIVEYSQTHHIHTLAADRWNANAMLVQLSGEGLNILGFGQGFAAMCEPCRKTEVLIESGRLAHRGNPVLEWMANNVAIAEDAAGNIRPSRERSTEKIDGIVSLVMAVGVHSTAVRTADPDWNIYVLD